MEPLREAGKLLFLFGVALIIVGGVLWLGARLPFKLGRLPGDMVFQGKHTMFYFPLVTCLVLSAAVTLILWLASVLRR